MKTAPLNVSEDLVGHPVDLECVLERGHHRLGGGAQHQSGTDAETAVVVESAHHLELGTIGQVEATDDVHLPQLH